MIFFLSACNEKKSLMFFRQYGYKQKEEKAFSTFFFNQLKKHFNKANQADNNQKDSDLFFHWKSYCRKNPIEEAITLVLCGILKVPQNKAAWLLKTPPRLVHFRLQQGLQSLGEELKEDSETPSSSCKTNAVNFCQKLAKENLPKKLEAFQADKKIILPIKLLLLLLMILLVGFTVFSLYKKKRTVILYQSLFTKEFKVLT